MTKRIGVWLAAITSVAVLAGCSSGDSGAESAVDQMPNTQQRDSGSSKESGTAKRQNEPVSGSDMRNTDRNWPGVRRCRSR